MRIRHFAVVSASMVLVLGACSATPPLDNQGGPGLPVQLPGETYPGEPLSVRSPLLVGTEGCFRLDVSGGERYVIWPADFTMDGDVVITDAGVRIAEGDEVTGEGRLTPVDDLFALEGPDGYWASVGGFCIRDEREVVVLDTVTAPRGEAASSAG